MAEGNTLISGVEHIERGYDNVIHQFLGLGAKLIIRDAMKEPQLHKEFIEKFIAQ